jgi:large subunit ribosomal protein L33
MVKAKGSRLIILLECTECRENKNQRCKGVSRYTTTKNRKNTSDRILLKKFCKYCNKHQVHKELK